jgi:hypothetical protein
MTQMQNGFLGRFIPGFPQSMMDMFTPDIPVKAVQIIIMGCNGFCGRCCRGYTHRHSFCLPGTEEKIPHELSIGIKIVITKYCACPAPHTFQGDYREKRMVKI